MIDKNFCMSSFLSFRYIERPDINFAEGFQHQNIQSTPQKEKVRVRSASDIDSSIKATFKNLENKKLGLLLSGGMDSAILASYMPGADAYTFRFLNGEYQTEELQRAEYYAHIYGLNLHYVDINWQTVENFLRPVMESKAAPVHSIEPQLFQAAIEAKSNGIECLIIGESSDLIFGGMDQLLAKDWKFDEFVERYTFLNPKLVLNEPVDMSYLFEKYRQGDNIDFLRFMDEVFSIESSSSYFNAFKAADIAYCDPYSRLIMAEPLDLKRVRNGEPKYLIRDLFKMKYPNFPVPFKNPMPRPVDYYFANWSGPTRSEFKENINLDKLSGNQRWQLYCLEEFLNLIDSLKLSKVSSH